MNKNNIPGIHNYCDRWCERCTFTSRCAVFESTSKLSSEQLDSENKEFWDNLSFNFTEVVDVLKKAAEKYGIDFNEVLNKETTEEEERKRQEHDYYAKNHPITKLCREYSKLCRSFLKDQTDFTEKVRELVGQGHLGIKSEDDIIKTTIEIGDAYEVVQWYMFFIEMKIQRALRGKLEDAEEEEESEFPKDSDGSAKIALIAIEKSMAAFAKLHTYFPEQEDNILQALSILQQLKRNAEAEFPNANAFVRPGFDTEKRK